MYATSRPIELAGTSRHKTSIILLRMNWIPTTECKHLVLGHRKGCLWRCTVAPHAYVAWFKFTSTYKSYERFEVMVHHSWQELALSLILYNLYKFVNKSKNAIFARDQFLIKKVDSENKVENKRHGNATKPGFQVILFLFLAKNSNQS